MNGDAGDSTFRKGLDWEAVGRYLAGESSAEETAAVRRKLEESPDDARLVELLARAGPTAPVDVEAALRRLHARLDDARVLPLGIRRPVHWMRSRHVPALAAAAAALLIAGATVMWQRSRSRVVAATAAAEARTYVSAVGERITIRLDDGSTVVLGPASTLDVPAGYGRTERAVTLRGEAFFVVKHDAARPLAVRAGPMTVRDVGTQFIVRQHEGGVRVAVTEGIVTVETRMQRQPVELRVGEVADADTGGQITARRKAVMVADTAWTAGQLVFDDAAMTDVRDGLRRWYGVELRVDDALASRHVTATFRGEPVDRVLEVLALTLGARAQLQGSIAELRVARSGAR